MIYLVVFLGNFGKKYKNNRHNVAWAFADSIKLLKDLSWQKKFNGQFCQLKVKDKDENENTVYFLKPETYMNISGKSIFALCDFYKIKPENVLVVHDETEIAMGYLGLKMGGGLGGHNGLRSTKEHLGTSDFWRLRFGIGRPTHQDLASFVLSDFTEDENSILYFVFKEASELLSNLLIKEAKSFLPKWNKMQIVSE